MATFNEPKGEVENFYEKLCERTEPKALVKLDQLDAKEIAATNRPDSNLLSASLVRETLDAAYKSALAQIALVNGEHLSMVHRETLHKEKLLSAGQIRHIYQAFAGLQLNPLTLANAIHSMNSAVNNIRNVEHRLSAIEREQREMGSVVLSLETEVEVCQLSRIGKIIGISEGLDGLPYYQIRMKDKHTGQYGKDPMDIVHCYARQLSFDKRKLLTGDRHAKD